MTLINTFSYETIARRRAAARRLAVMSKPAEHPGDRRQADLLLINEALHFRAYEDTDPTKTADPLGAGEPGIEVLMGFLAEELHKLHRRLDTLDRHAADLMFLQLSSQHLLFGKRRPFSRDSRDVMIRVLGAEPYKGRCPCCMDERVLAEGAQPAPGAECDHFFHCSLNKPEHGWLICTPCHRELTYDGYLARFRRVPEFRRFQAAVLRQQRRAQMRPDDAGP